MAAATMEQTIAALERAGWRMQNLSQTPSSRWSCILERRSRTKGGDILYASSPLSDTPAEALAAAWEATQARETVPARLLPRLKLAVAAARAALATPDDDDDTF